MIKIIKPGTFREMLANKGDLSVDELKRFLRAMKNHHSLSNCLSDIKHWMDRNLLKLNYDKSDLTIGPNSLTSRVRLSSFH